MRKFLGYIAASVIAATLVAFVVLDVFLSLGIVFVIVFLLMGEIKLALLTLVFCALWQLIKVVLKAASK